MKSFKFHALILTLAGLLLIFAAACGTAPPPADGPQDESLTESDGAAAIAAIARQSDEMVMAPPPAADAAAPAPAAESGQDGIEVGFTADGRPYRGSSNAPIVIREYSDYQCPFCARFTQQTMPSLLADQIASGDVRLVFYDFPLTSIHPQALPAANAARCAGEQGAAAYWQMHDRLFDTVSQWGNSRAPEQFSRLAADIGLDVAAFDTCVAELRYEAEITADLRQGQSEGINSTPSFFVNDQPVIGAQPIGVFDEVITALQEGRAPSVAQPQPQPAAPAAAPTPASVRTDDIVSALGDPDAPVQIIEYTDYQCPYCARHALETLPALIGQLVDSGRVYYMVKDFPLDSIHPEARIAAVAARCAAEQNGGFWPMHDELFATQQQWGGVGEAAAKEIFISQAAALKLDTDAFGSCLDSSKYDAAIQANLDEGVSLGVRGTPAFFIDGFPVSGAQPLDLFTYAVELAEEGSLAQAYVRPAEPTPVPTPSGPIEIPIGDAYAVGDPAAPVTIVEYTDFQCPFCARHVQQTYPQIKQNYIDQGLVYYVFKDFPLTNIHPEAVLAAQAARCAGDQNAYVAMHGLLFAAQDAWAYQSTAAEQFVELANRLGLDETAFTSCLESDVYVAAVEADLQEGVQFGVRGTPGFFINGYFLNGAQPYSTFVEAIDSFLADQ